MNMRTFQVYRNLESWQSNWPFRNSEVQTIIKLFYSYELFFIFTSFENVSQ